MGNPPITPSLRRPCKCSGSEVPESLSLLIDCRAGVAGAFIDREVETRGLDEYSKVQAKRHAQDQIDRNFDQGAYDSYQQ